MRAVHLTAFGDPVRGLEFVDIPEPAAPSVGQVLIGVEFSPIDLSDLLVASGAYPFRPSLPSVIGNEGVGRILAVGPGVENVAVGDRVLTPLYGLAWAERIVASAEGLFALPPDVDPRQLAMLTINPPTAGLLLSEFVDLAPGDWVVQNAANSGVGRAVIALAKARGLGTINLVRRPELIDELKALGGDLVIVDGPEGVSQVKAALGTAAPRLAIDGVGGSGAAALIDLLGRDGTLAAYAALSKAPITVSALALIFKRISVRGFFLSDPEHASKMTPFIVEAADLLLSGLLHAPVAANFPLSAIKVAVAHVHSGGKVLLDVEARSGAAAMGTTKGSGSMTTPNGDATGFAGHRYQCHLGRERLRHRGDHTSAIPGPPRRRSDAGVVDIRPRRSGADDSPGAVRLGQHDLQSSRHPRC